jgi:beta-lactamase class A
MKRIVSLSAVFAALAVCAFGQAQPGAGLLRQHLAHRLETLADDLDGVMGYVVIDLTTGERMERLAGHVFPTASSIKLAILYELFKQAEEGRVKLDGPIAWDAKQAVGGSGVLFELSNPTLSLRDYATLMVVLSDNTATNVVIDALGMDRVNARMQALGLGDIRLRRRMMDLEAARHGDENVATPTALARLLAMMEKGEGVTPASREAMLGILKKGKTSPLLRGIPPGVPVASKPGDLDGVRADAAIVYVPGRPYVLVAMTSWLQKDEEGERAIEEASRAVYQYFERLATGSEYGRKIGP